MAIIKNNNIITALAAENLDATHEGLVASVAAPFTPEATAEIGSKENAVFGVLLRAAEQGKTVEIALPGNPGIIEMRAGANWESIKPGTPLGAGTDGKADPTAETKFATAVTAPTAEDALFDAILNA